MSSPGKADPSPSVLVVDDLADQADSLAAVLSLYGFAVRVSYSGEDALRQAAAELPDVVLTDLAMSGVDGWELARRLRELAPLRPPVVVAVSGCGRETDRRRSAESGIDLHLLKPVEPSVLVAVLGRLRAATPGVRWGDRIAAYRRRAAERRRCLEAIDERVHAAAGLARDHADRAAALSRRVQSFLSDRGKN